MREKETESEWEGVSDKGTKKRWNFRSLVADRGGAGREKNRARRLNRVKPTRIYDVGIVLSGKITELFSLVLRHHREKR